MLVISLIFGFSWDLALTHTTSFISRNVLIRNILGNGFYLISCPTVKTECSGFDLSVFIYLGITLVLNF